MKLSLNKWKNNMKYKIPDFSKTFKMITLFSYVFQHRNIACVSGTVGWTTKR